MANNLLDKSSIILTPTAYDNGEALCVKPSDGSGDFDFSRNSAATRVNAQGLVENVQILSSNLVQNGDFSEEGAELVTNGSFTNGTNDWQTEGGSSIVVGDFKGKTDVAKININNTSTGSRIRQPFNYVSGKTYKVDIEVYVQSGNFRADSSDSFVSGDFVSTSTLGSWQTLTANVTAISTGSNYIWLRSISVVSEFYISNISVKEVGQNWSVLNATITDVGNLNGTGVTSLLYQNILTNGKTYTATFTISNYNGLGIAKVINNSGAAIYTITSNGTFTITFTHSNVNGNFLFRAQNSAMYSVDDVSVIEITDDTNLPRINYEGFSYQDALGSEEIVNGDFSNGSTNWSITQSGNDTIIIENGYALFNCPDNSNIFIAQPSVLTIGKTYKASFNVLSIDTGGFLFAQGGGGTIFGSPTINTTGTHSFIFVAATATFGIKRALGSPNLLNGSIDNVSVKEVTGQEVVPDSGCGSWLFEPQSTNLLPYSSDYSGWSKNGASVLSGFVSPDGTTNASKITAASADPNLYKIVDVGLGKVTFSFYAKADEPYIGRILFWQIGTAVVSGAISHNFTLSNDWQRYEATIEVITAGTLAFRLDFPINSGGNVGEYGYLWGAQVEQQSYATSYIPTSGSTVTRNQDLCTNGGSLASINSTSGTLYFEGKRLSLLGSKRTISISDGSLNNYLYIQFQGVSNTIRIFYKTAETGQVLLLNYNSTNPIEFGKYAFKWSNANFSLWVNGIKELEQLTGSTATSNVFNTIDFSLGNGADKFFGKTKALAVWKEALSDAELTELTTI